MAANLDWNFTSYKNPSSSFNISTNNNNYQVSATPSSLIPLFQKNMENSPLWLSLTNMIYIFFLTSVVKFIHKFIVESNSFIKSLIPLFVKATKTTENDSVSADYQDEEGDLIHASDLSILMKKMGLSWDQEEQMTSDEVSRIFEEREPSIEELRAAFDVFDENKDGFVDAFELKRVIEILGLGKGYDLGACKRMIRAFDEDGDDRIDSDEFIGLMRITLC